MWCGQSPALPSPHLQGAIVRSALVLPRLLPCGGCTRPGGTAGQCGLTPQGASRGGVPYTVGRGGLALPRPPSLQWQHYRHGSAAGQFKLICSSQGSSGRWGDFPLRGGLRGIPTVAPSQPYPLSTLLGQDMARGGGVAPTRAEPAHGPPSLPPTLPSPCPHY